MKGISEFSRQIPGTRGNFHWPVRFDILDGYVGISQLHPAGGQWERVLLSPNQVSALAKFLGEKKAGLLRRPR